MIDDLTFEVEPVDSDAEFPIQLKYAAYFPLPSVFYDDPVAYEDRPIGNGSLMVDADGWQHDLSVGTVPYPDYIGSNPAQVSSLTFQIYESVDTAFLDLRAGNLDIVDQLPLDQLETAPAEFGDRYGVTPAGVVHYYGFPAYLNDVWTLDLRRVLSMAVDRDLIVRTITNNARIPANSAIPPSISGARTDVCDNWNFDPAQAKQVFDDAGGWQEDELIVWFNSGSNWDQITEAIVNMWVQHLGIDPDIVRFEQLPFSEYLPLIDDGLLTGMFRLGWGQDYPSPLNFLEPLYASYNFAPTGSNSFFYDNPEFDGLLDQGKKALAASGSLDDAIPFYQQG